MGSRDSFAFSPDGKRKLKSYVNYESVREFECVREVWNADTEELLYRLSDETIAIQYDDYHKPEGCDLKSFSYCGNVYDPSVATPYRVAFSSSGASLAILYRASNLWNSNRFSTLRVYRGEDGVLLHTIGSFKQPVETFAYSPDGNLLLVGYVDGSTQLWDIARGIVTFSAWHFSAPIIALKYSSDGDFLILQRPDWLEVRRTSDGALRSRYQATAFAVSPTENLVAIGTKDGSILVQNIDTGQEVYHIQAHNDEVYALVFSPDGQRLTSSGQDCTVSNWDAHTGRFLNYFEENITDAYQGTNTASRIFIYHMRYISRTNQLIGYGSWARVVSWDANSGATQYLIEPEPLEYYQGMMTLNPHFPEFFGIDLENQHFYVDNIGYDLETGEKVGEYQLPIGLPEGCAPTGPISRDGELLFTRGYDSREGQICILDAKDLHLVKTIEIVPRDAYTYVTVDWIYLSPDGKQLIINTLNGSIYVYGIAP
jgi:WD40 repeat protein